MEPLLDKLSRLREQKSGKLIIRLMGVCMFFLPSAYFYVSSCNGYRQPSDVVLFWLSILFGALSPFSILAYRKWSVLTVLILFSIWGLLFIQVILAIVFYNLGASGGTEHWVS
jgi:hypothetical protein